jgi:hypothetical protein
LMGRHTVAFIMAPYTHTKGGTKVCMYIWMYVCTYIMTSLSEKLHDPDHYLVGTSISKSASVSKLTMQKLDRKDLIPRSWSCGN